ncbi:oligosaccharide flippase family protein [bacterium]|nr:oligosaccharide flippase family protein [bacterium]
MSQRCERKGLPAQGKAGRPLARCRSERIPSGKPGRQSSMAPTVTARFFRLLAGHTVVFGLSTLVRPLSQLILVRLHTNTHFLSVSEYASWTLLQVALNIGIVLFNLGLATAFFRFYLAAQSDDERERVVGRMFRITLTAAIAGGAMLAAGSAFWTYALTGKDGLFIEGIHIAIAVSSNTLTIVPLALMRAEGRWKSFLAFNTAKFFLLIGLNALFLIPLGFGLPGVTLALAATNALLALAFVPMLRGRMKGESWTAGWKPVLLFAAPLLANDFTFWLLNSLGQVMLRFLGSEADVALFGFALRISFIAMVMVIMPFTIAFGPLLFRARKENEDPRPLYARSMGYIWTLSLAFCLALTLFAPEAALLLGKNPLYHAAVPQVGVLAFAAPFYGIFYVFSAGANLRDKTWVFPILLAAAAVVQILLMLWWIPLHGIAGAAWGTLAGYALLALLTLGTNQRLYPIRFPWYRVGLAGLTVLLLLKLHQSFDFLHGIRERIGLTAAFPVLLLLLGYLDRGEWAALRRLLGLHRGD